MKFRVLLFFVLVTMAGRAHFLDAAESKKNRPNFLFIYTDDQRYDSLGVVQREQGDRGRFPWMSTPNIDRLANEGLRFRNAFVTMSLCSPSRAAFLTGRYNHANGIANNHTAFSDSTQTYASLLRTAGYSTGYVGKWHMGPQKGQRPGFDFSASFVGQGIYENCPIEVNGVVKSSSGWVDDVSTDYAINFMEQNKAKPFALVVGYKSAHGPFTPPERMAKKYEGENARPVPNLSATAIYKEGSGPNAKKGADKKATDKKAGSQPATSQTAPKTNLGYFRCLTAIDENVGRLMKTLDDLSLAENTVVVYTSDNGFYLGEHGLGDKRSAYDESLRIPMIIRDPVTKTRGVRDEMVLNIDIAPTFLQMAGVNVPADVHGRSLAPLLESTKPIAWRSAFFYEYFLERGFAIPTILAVRATNAKLIRYPGHEEWTELFDLKADPYELTNLYGTKSAAELRRQMEAEFEKQAKAVNFAVPSYADEKSESAAPESKPRKPVTGLVLDYNFQQLAESKIPDQSGYKHDGKSSGVVLIEGREGRQAAKFDGKSSISVGRSETLDPSNMAFELEAVVRTDAPNGVIIARGGQSFGYLLHISDGRPAFLVNSGGESTKVIAEKGIDNRWVRLRAKLTTTRKMLLYVDDELVGEKTAPSLIGKDPSDGLDVGADNGSPLVEPRVSPFVGLCERIRIRYGE